MYKRLSVLRYSTVKRPCNVLSVSSLSQFPTMLVSQQLITFRVSHYTKFKFLSLKFLETRQDQHHYKLVCKFLGEEK